MATRTLQCTFSEHVYTGNHPRGQNYGNYADMETLLRAAGLDLRGDDLDIIIFNLERDTGKYALEHRGKTLRYRVQRHRAAKPDSFGYTWSATYTILP